MQVPEMLKQAGGQVVRCCCSAPGPIISGRARRGHMLWWLHDIRPPATVNHQGKASTGLPART
jgi:hypothetical protein